MQVLFFNGCMKINALNVYNILRIFSSFIHGFLWVCACYSHFLTQLPICLPLFVGAVTEFVAITVQRSVNRVCNSIRVFQICLVFMCMRVQKKFLFYRKINCKYLNLLLKQIAWVNCAFGTPQQQYLIQSSKILKIQNERTVVYTKVGFCSCCLFLFFYYCCIILAKFV